MASNEQIINEADYYLNNNVNIDQASEALGISRRTFQLHMKKLEEIHPAKASLVQTKKAGNIKAGNILGGATGKRGPTWSEEKAIEVAATMLEHQMSYNEAASYFGIPKSTLHEMVTKGGQSADKLSLLYILAEANNRGLDMNEFLRQFHGRDVDIDSAISEMRKYSQEEKNKGKK